MAGISRRAWLARMAAGSASVAWGMAQLRHALALGTVEPGVARVRGDARINGKPAQRGREVKPGDVITTGPDAELVVVVGRDAFLVRAQSRIEFNGGQSHLLVASLRVVTGALLSVFEPDRPKQIRTPTATIGIRGTAVYVELEPSRTYVCTCYGEAELTPVDDPSAAETVRTRHHDEPRYIYPRGMPRRMEKAPVINHTDAELGMLEGLVGRTVPFDPSLYR